MADDLSFLRPSSPEYTLFRVLVQNSVDSGVAEAPNPRPISAPTQSSSTTKSGVGTEDVHFAKNGAANGTGSLDTREVSGWKIANRR